MGVFQIGRYHMPAWPNDVMAEPWFHRWFPTPVLTRFSALLNGRFNVFLAVRFANVYGLVIPMATVSLLDVENAVGRDLTERRNRRGRSHGRAWRQPHGGRGHGQQRPDVPEIDDDDLPVHRYEPLGDGAQEVP